MSDFARIVAHAWSDRTFKQKLFNDPVAALAEHGVEVRKGLTVRVIEDTADAQHLVLPAAPDNANELSRQELEKRVGTVRSLIVDLMVESGISGMRER